jgi:hypothetical protein
MCATFQEIMSGNLLWNDGMTEWRNDKRNTICPRPFHGRGIKIKSNGNWEIQTSFWNNQRLTLGVNCFWHLERDFIKWYRFKKERSLKRFYFQWRPKVRTDMLNVVKHIQIRISIIRENFMTLSFTISEKIKKQFLNFSTHISSPEVTFFSKLSDRYSRYF